ncbi:MAG: outer membrane protein assembly factor BamD [Bacteroidota bacterium]|nr:outer membrane protein assembly factor BamD [Bacteroidota bacterium]
MKFKQLISAILLITLLLGTGACKYHKIKKSKDPDVKMDAAYEYYEDGKYAKAIPLFEDIILMKRNTAGYEKILFRFADSYYHVKDYILAGYYYRKFTEAFPKSKQAEDAQYMSAYCYYLNTPKSSLDQTDTYTALQEFGVFLSKYPDSEKVEECNSIIDELRTKLEKKAFENARLYFYREQYNAAIVALNSTLKKYPDTKYEEKTLFIILKASLLYAEKSVVKKQEERYKAAKTAYKNFTAKFPNSEFRNEASKINDKITEKLKEIKSV